MMILLEYFECKTQSLLCKHANILILVHDSEYPFELTFGDIAKWNAQFRRFTTLRAQSWTDCRCSYFRQMLRLSGGLDWYYEVRTMQALSLRE